MVDTVFQNCLFNGTKFENRENSSNSSNGSTLMIDLDNNRCRKDCDGGPGPRRDGVRDKRLHHDHDHNAPGNHFYEETIPNLHDRNLELDIQKLFKYLFLHLTF